MKNYYTVIKDDVNNAKRLISQSKEIKKNKRKNYYGKGQNR